MRLKVYYLRLTFHWLRLLKYCTCTRENLSFYWWCCLYLALCCWLLLIICISLDTLNCLPGDGHQLVKIRFASSVKRSHWGVGLLFQAVELSFHSWIMASPIQTSMWTMAFHHSNLSWRTQILWGGFFIMYLLYFMNLWICYT